MSDSAPRLSSLQLLRSSAVTVPPTADSLRAMAIAPASDSSFLLFLCRTIFPSFLMPSSRYQPQLPPALAVPVIQPETTATSLPASSPTPHIPTGRRRSSRLSAQSLVLTSLLWSLAIVCVADAQSCGKTNSAVGFVGNLATPQDLGTIRILDDCSFVHETTALVNNRSLLGLNWIGQLRTASVPLTIGVVAMTPLTGADTTTTYQLITGLTWSDIDILAIADGNLVVKSFVNLGIGTTTTTVPQKTTTTTTVPTKTTTTTLTTTVPPATTTSTASPTTGGSAVQTITITDPILPIVVTVGPNPHYPGLTPTQLNVSLYINGIESPVLLLTRGLLYRFSIQAGTSHPVYITSDIDGGHSSSTEIIRAGNGKSFGSASSPFILPFFAPFKGQIAGLNDSAPLFYQCYVHRRMGWMIVLQDSNSTPIFQDNGSLGANVATRGSIHLALLVAFLASIMLFL